MGKVVAKVGMIVGAVALVATGVGAIAMPGLAGVLTIGGIKASTLLLAGAAMQALGTALTPKPKLSASTTDRLNASLVTDTPRKIAFGHTALNTDLRYQEWWGSEQEYCSQVFVLASHWCESVDEIYLDDKLAWTAAGGVTGEFAGYLVVGVHAQAVLGSVYNAGWSRRWGTTATFSGCATLYLQFKVTGNGKKGKSPFSTQITSRVTVVGKGARLPDPRFDSTVGGAGHIRVADQSTWAWAPGGYEAGRNPALALLFYLLGWRIQNPTTGEWKLAIGCGVPVDRIDLGSFMTAANMCDEPVLRADGTYEPRYRCDGTFSAADEPLEVFASLEACMNAKLRDSAGRFTLQVLHNDLATPVVEFTDDDVLGDFTWTAGNDLNDRKNVVRGRLTDPSSLYQLIDFPAVRIAPIDGIERIDSVDFALVQSASQAQRLAKQRLQRTQYQGAFAAEFNARGWAVKDGDPVTLTFAALGFNKKKFRVAEGVVDPTGVVPLVLVEEHDAIYAWDRGESASVQAAAPNRFDPLLLPVLQAIDEAGTTAEWPAITGEGKPEDYATVGAPGDTPVGDLTGVLVADALKAMAEAPTGDDVIAGAQALLERTKQTVEVLRELVAAPDQSGMLEGARALVGRLRSNQASQLAAQLLAEARKQRTDALLHLDGIPVGTRVRQEITQRIEGDAAIVERIVELTAKTETDIGDVVAAIQEEARLRADADSAETSQREAAISAVTGLIGDETAARVAAITAEATTRADAISAETQQREAAISTVTGLVDGERSAREAAIASEASTRADAISAETQQREAAISTVTGLVDGERSAREAAIASEATTRADAISAETQQREAAISTVTGLVDGERTAREAAIASEAITRADAISAETQQREAAISTVTGLVDGERSAREAAIASEATTRADAISAETQQREAAISTVTGLVDGERSAREAAIASEATTRADAISAETQQREAAISTVSGMVDGERSAREAAIASEATTRADAISAETQQREAAISTVTGLVDGERSAREAAIASEATTRADAISAETQQREAAISTVAGLVDGERSAREAAIVNEQTTRADAVGAVASAVQSLGTVVDGQSASVSLLLETVNGQTANAQLVTNVTGQITGFRINGQESLFLIAADRFVVGADQAFEVVNGVTRIKRLVIGNGNVGFDELLLQSLIKRGLDSSAGGTQPTLGGGNQFADFAVPLGTINPAGTFTLKFLGAPALPMHQDYTTTLNGKPAYFRYVNDGGFAIRCVDAQGNVYSFGGDRYLDDRSVKATTPFEATFVATITRGNTDTGWVEDGDYYYRYVSQQYSIGAFEAELTWRAL